MSTVHLLRLDDLVLESWHRQKVLEEEVEEDQSVELQVAVVRLLKRLLCDLDDDLRDVKAFVRNKLSFHFLASVGQQVLVAPSTPSRRELVDSLARTALHEVAR